MNHTPTPWGYTYDGSSEWSIGPAADPQSNPVMSIWSRNDDRARANAAFIVRAVNCHDELIDACRDALHALEVTNPEALQGSRSQARIRLMAKRELRVVIAKAEGL